MEPLITERNSTPQVKSFLPKKVRELRSRPYHRGERLLDGLNTIFLRINQWVKKGLPGDLNPFAQMGAVANTLFVISLISGILLLFWYSPSIHFAYNSLQSLTTGSVLGQLMRSLHRYSSDGMMLFLILHAFQVLFAGKFSGPRWLAWVSGVVLVGLIWLDGWLGYWLVWDQRAQMVAVDSAKVLDVLPFFTDPLMRSFLTNESVNSLLFFLVFFMHMLIPLGIGIGLWIHIMRLNQSVFFTRRRLSIALVVSLVGISLIYPATSAARADMLTIPQNLSIDWFYLFPLIITERLQGGTIWLIALVGFIGAASIPWLLVKRKAQVARVLETRCNGCTQCYQDCPYNAITMVPRVDKNGRSEVYASIDPARCVGCGICVGSCDPAGVMYPLLEPLDVRKWIDTVLKDHTGNGSTGPLLAFVCAESAGGNLLVNARGESEQLPGFRVLAVPCIGWVHPLLIERAVRKGAAGVLIAGCDVDPYCRKGTAWTAERLEGNRKPALRKEKLNSASIWYVNYDRTETKAFLETAHQLVAKGHLNNPKKPASFFVRWGIAVAVVIALSVVTVIPSDAPLVTSGSRQPELVVSFKHPGQLVEKQMKSSGADAELLPHMRGAATLQRVRVPVRMRIFLDNKEVLMRSYKPAGLFNDGISQAIEKVPLSPGHHRIRIEIGDSPNPNEWQYVNEKELEIKSNNRRHVVLFDRVSGFRWY